MEPKKEQTSLASAALVLAMVAFCWGGMYVMITGLVNTVLRTPMTVTAGYEDLLR